MDDFGGGRPGPADLAILAYAGALLVLWSPLLHLGLLTPRILVMLTALGPGLVVLVGLARRGDSGARWAGAYLLWALLAVVVAKEPWRALAGTFGADIGWIYLAGFFSAWGLGRHLSPRGRQMLAPVLLVGIGVNAIVGILEALLDPTGDLATEAGRVHGLVSNSLYLGGLLVGALAALGYLVGSGSPRRLLALGAVVPVAMATNLTGSRAALVGGALIAVAAALVAGRPSGVRRSSAVALAIVVGFALSVPLQSAQAGSTRLGDTATSSGYDSRTIMWRAGLEALGERPLTGWGPGRFREATSPRTTAAFVRAEGPDKLFFDAHNLFVEHLVTTGVVGLLLLLGFIWHAIRHARGPLAWLGAGIALTWLLNPVSTVTGTIALLAVGAAWTEPVPRTQPRSVGVGMVVGAVLGVVGMGAGLVLVRADAHLDVAVDSGDVEAARAASDLLPWDSVVTGILAEAQIQEAGEDPSPAQAQTILDTTRRALRQDSTRAYWWARLGFRDFDYGTGTEAERLERSKRAFDEALRLSPWSVEAMLGLRGVAEKEGDGREVDRLTDRLCEVRVCLPPDP